MPSTTAGGLPYPLPTEQAKDGAVAIQNLANALQVRGAGWMTQTGSGVVTLNASGDGQIPIGTPFKAGTKPIVLMQVTDPLAAYFVVPNYAAATNAAMPFRMYTPAAGTPAAGPYRVQWIAIGVAA